MPRPPKNELRDWYTTPEAAALFEVGTATIREWIDLGKLHAENHNGYWRIPKTSAQDLANQYYGAIENLPEPPSWSK